MAPFSGNIVELCPVGALTSQPYRFRARPWDIESAGGICNLCPAQCNVTFTVRDERVLRVLARDYEGNEGVDDGWLCDKGRFAYQSIHVDERITKPLVRDGGELREVSWERALETAAGLARHKGHVGALVGGQATNEEGFLLQRLHARGAGLRRHRLALGRRCRRPDRCGRCRRRRCRRASSTSSSPTPSCWSAASRSTTRRSSTSGSARACGATASRSRSRARDRARSIATRSGSSATRPAARPNSSPSSRPRCVGGEERRDDERAIGALADLLRDGGEDVVIVWSERIGEAAAARCCGSPSGSDSPTTTAPGCSRSRRAPTAAAFARLA